jgi:hypothetical protein
MGEPLNERALAELLPGTWSIAATNFPMWLAGDRLEPRFGYEVIGQNPLVLSDEVSYLTAEGERKHIVGRDTWRGGGFVWRGSGWLRFFASRWAVAGVSDDRTVAVVRFSKSPVTPAGVDIIVREDVHHPELRAMVAGSTEQFDLSPEDFATLSWLAPAGRG